MRLLANSLLLLILNACATTGQVPVWQGKLYPADSKNQAIVRSASAEQIACNSPQFDNYVCMSYGDMEAFFQTFVLGCKTWNKGTPKDTVANVLAPHAQVLTHTLPGKAGQ